MPVERARAVVCHRTKEPTFHVRCFAHQFVTGTTSRRFTPPAGGCVGGYVTDTKSHDRHTNDFRKRLFTLCMAWSSYHTGPRTFRGRKREPFPRRMREICQSGSMSGNKKQNQAKPD